MRAIVMFVKAPVPGSVKTRLAQSIGPKKAALLYRAMARRTLAVAERVPAAKVVVAYQAHPKLPHVGWLTRSAAAFAQQGADLGERLIHAFNKLFQAGDGPVIVIGSDLPTLTPELLKRTFQILKQSSVVIGPSQDGGYYLIGLRSPQPELFRNIAWSTPRVLKQTLASVKSARLSCRLLPVRQDIDTIQDLLSVLAKC